MEQMLVGLSRRLRATDRIVERLRLTDHQSELRAWQADTATWTRTANDTFTVAGDREDDFPEGMSLRCVQSATTKYFYVVESVHAAGTTTVTVAPANDEVLAAGAISDAFRLCTAAEALGGSPVSDGGALYWSVIAAQVLGGSAANITFSNIPGAFRHLEITTLLRSAVAGEFDAAFLRFNGDSGNNYHRREVVMHASYASNAGRSQSSLYGVRAEGNTATANRVSNGIIHIPFYASSKLKGMFSHSFSGGNVSADTDIMLNFNAGFWDNTAPITSVALLPALGANWLAGCQAVLYGVM